MPKPESDAPRLVVFFGLVASGKSHLAKRWARARHCPYYNTDIVRKQLFGLDPHSRQHAGMSQGIYTAEHSRQTYREIVRRVRNDLDERSREVVVLDGSYREEAERARLVTEFGGRAGIFFIYCSCSEAETRKRLARRALDRHAVSDGRWEVYLYQKSGFAVPHEIEGARLLVLDTENDTDVLLRTVDAFVDTPVPGEDRSIRTSDGFCKNE